MTTNETDLNWIPDADDEIWCDIKEFEGLYEIAPDGRVRSVDRIVERAGDGYRWQHRRGVLRKSYIRKDGHEQISLSDAQHRRHTRSVAKLVAETFGEAP